MLSYTVCRKLYNFSFVLSNAVFETVGLGINAIPFTFFEAVGLLAYYYNTRVRMRDHFIYCACALTD